MTTLTLCGPQILPPVRLGTPAGLAWNGECDKLLDLVTRKVYTDLVSSGSLPPKVTNVFLRGGLGCFILFIYFLKIIYLWDAWVAQQLSACLRPRA